MVCLPMVNLYLQSRAPDARRRGGAALPWCTNCAEPACGWSWPATTRVTRSTASAIWTSPKCLREGVRIGHLDLPVGDWPAAMTALPAEVMGELPAGVLRVGGVRRHRAVFAARSYSELFSRPQSDRIVLRAGRAIDTTLPALPRVGPSLRMTSELRYETDRPFGRRLSPASALPPARRITLSCSPSPADGVGVRNGRGNLRARRRHAAKHAQGGVGAVLSSCTASGIARNGDVRRPQVKQGDVLVVPPRPGAHAGEYRPGQAVLPDHDDAGRGLCRTHPRRRAG